jgi:hypothetical protein
MLATVSFAFGILLAVIVLAVTRRRVPEGGGQAPKPTTLGWCTLVFGLAAVTAFALALWGPPTGNIPGVALGLPTLSIALAAATVVVGVGAFMRRVRHWPTWVGLFAGLVPALFWITFAAGYILGFGE